MLKRIWGSSTAPAGSLASKSIDERETSLLHASRGMEMIMNDDMGGAGKALDAYDDAFHRSGSGVSKFLRAMLGFEKEQIAASAEQLEKALTSCENELSYAKALPNSKFPAGAEFNVCIGNTLLQLALTGFISESVPEAMKAVFKMRRAYNIFHALHSHMISCSIIPMANPIRINEAAETTASSPTEHNNVLGRIDTQHMKLATGHQSGLSVTDFFIACTTLCGHGLLSLIISLMPPTVARILSVIGFKGNKGEALSILWSVAHAPNIQGSIALLALLSYYNSVVAFCDIIEDEGDALERLDAALQATILRYPKSALWKLQSARMQVQLGDLQGGIRTLETVEAKGGLKQIESLKLYELSFSYLTTLEWQKAADSFIMVERMNDWSKPLYFFVIGSCFVELYRDTGDIKYAEKAQEYLLKAPVDAGKKKILGKEIPIEVYIKRKITKWQARAPGRLMVEGITVSPIAEFSHLFNFWKKMTKELQLRSLVVVQRLGPQADTRDDLLTRQLMTCALQRNMRDWRAFNTIEPESRQSRNAFRQIPHAETWAIPFAQYEHAACYWSRDGMSSKDNVRHWLEKAKNFGDSELEQRLAIKVSTALEAISAKG